MSVHTRNGLSHTAMTGIKELPSNTAWLLSKALKPVVHGAAAASSPLSDSADAATSTAGTVVDSTKRVTGKVISSLSGRDSVTQLMTEADLASAHAREAESRAVELAEQAQRDVETASRVTADANAERQHVRSSLDETMAARVGQAEDEAAATVAEIIREQEERVKQARVRAERHVESVRSRENAEARKQWERVEAETAKRASAAQRGAQESKARAATAIEQADAALTRAQDLANQAAAAAQEAAAAATREAQLLAHEAKQRASEAQKRAAAADRARERTGSRTQTVDAKRDRGFLNGDALLALAKPNLVAVAQAMELEGATQMNKGELATALERTHVSLDVLTKRDLLRVAESKGLDVRQSMSKQELIDSIS